MRHGTGETVSPPTWRATSLARGQQPLKGKVLIANRGEIALRIMGACQELDLDYAVVYTAADENSQHVRLNRDSNSSKNKAHSNRYGFRN